VAFAFSIAGAAHRPLDGVDALDAAVDDCASTLSASAGLVVGTTSWAGGMVFWIGRERSFMPGSLAELIHSLAVTEKRGLSSLDRAAAIMACAVALGTFWCAPACSCRCTRSQDRRRHFILLFWESWSAGAELYAWRHALVWKGSCVSLAKPAAGLNNVFLVAGRDRAYRQLYR